MSKTYVMGLLMGDGIGPEISTATQCVIDAMLQHMPELDFEWRVFPMGHDAIQQYNHPMPQHVIDELGNTHAWILGPHDSVSYPSELKHLKNPSAYLRINYDLYANIRPTRTFSGVPSRYDNIDLVIVRENTEGFYADRNMVTGNADLLATPDVAIPVGLFTRRAAERITRQGFDLAKERRQHVTLVHKANVLRNSHGIYRDVGFAFGQDNPAIAVDEYHIDAMAAMMVRDPARFDVIITTNMFGDILSDMASEMAGSLGLGSAINAGDDKAMAQAAHGSAPDIAGRGIANPVGLMQSATALLQWMSTRYADKNLSVMAARIDDAIRKTIESHVCTVDLGGDAGTDAFTQRVISNLSV